MTDKHKAEQGVEMTGGILKRGAAIIGIAGFIVAATAGLHIRAAVDDDAAAVPLPVASQIIERQRDYSVFERFTGRIEPLQTVDIAFEQPGKLTAIMVDEGDTVKEGDVIATLDLDLLNARLKQAEATKDRIAAQLELALVTEKRQKALFEQGHTNQQRYDEARLNTVTLRARSAEAEAQVLTAQINISKAVLYAPFDGRISRRMVDIGGVQLAGGPIVTIMQEGADLARFSLPVRKANNLSVGDVRKAFYAGSETDVRVSSIRRDVNPLTRTQDVLFELADGTENDRNFAFGDLLELSLADKREDDGYWIPTDALVEGPKGLWTIFTIEDGESGQVVVRRGVEILYAEATRVYVRANLGARAEIIASGVHRVVPGQTVAAIRRGQS